MSDSDCSTVGITSDAGDKDDCIIVQVFSPDPTQFEILQPLEELERQERKVAKRLRRKRRKSIRRRTPTPPSSSDDSELDDLFTMHVVNPKKSRIPAIAASLAEDNDNEDMTLSAETSRTNAKTVPELSSTDSTPPGDEHHDGVELPASTSEEAVKNVKQANIATFSWRNICPIF